METMSMFDTILYLLMTQSMASRASLVSLSSSKVPAYTSIKKALNLKYIKQCSMSYKLKGEKHTIKYITITLKGINYLRTKLGDDIPWLQFLDPTVTRLSVRGEKTKTTRVERFVRMASMAVMFAGIGVEVNHTFLVFEKEDAQDEDDARWWETDIDEVSGSYEVECEAFGEANPVGDETQRTKCSTLAALVSDALRAYETAQGQKQNRTNKLESELRFHDSVIMKRNLRNVEDGTETLDYIFGRYVGMIESCFKSVLIYAEFSDGMSWSSRVTDREVSAYKKCNRLHSNYKHIRYDDLRAGICINNPKAFADIYYDKKKRRGEEDHFGRPYTHFYIIPATYEGLHSFRAMMSEDDMASRQSLIDDAVESGLFTHNSEFDSDLFPLKNTNGTLFMLGNVMDIVQIQRLESISKKFDLDFGILCYPWQMDYYKRVFPKTKYMTME